MKSMTMKKVFWTVYFGFGVYGIFIILKFAMERQ